MNNKVKNIVCNHTNSVLIRNIEEYIQKKLDIEEWNLEVIQDSMIIALQNKLGEYNY